MLKKKAKCGHPSRADIISQAIMNQAIPNYPTVAVRPREIEQNYTMGIFYLPVRPYFFWVASFKL